MDKSQHHDSGSSAVTTLVPLQTNLFALALNKYLDEYKPDPLEKRQVESLQVEWTNNDKYKGIKEGSFAIPNMLPQHAICGTLQLFGEHLVLSVYAICTWGAGKEEKYLVFELSASARFLTKSEIRRREKQDKKEQRVASKVRAGMIQRLREDFYIRKLLDDTPVRLCIAAIQSSSASSKLEERVNVEEDSVEGARRAVLSQSDGALTTMEFLLCMPWLDNSELAHRAKLGLLEDAMVDACEKEGQDEILDDLVISEKAESENEQEVIPPRKQQQGNATKRSKGL